MLYFPVLQETIASLSILIAIALILIIGYIGRAIFEKFKIPEVLILISIGLILGPVGHLLPSTYTNTLGSLAVIFGDIALIIIVYNGGRIINILDRGIRNWRGFVLSVFDVLFTMIFATISTNLLFGWPIIDGVLLGAVLGSTSSTVIIPIIKRMKIPNDLYDILMVENSINSVIAILAFALITTFITNQALSFQSFSTYVLDYVSVAVFVGLVAGFGWVFIQSRIKAAREYLATIAVAILIFGFTGLFNGAGIIAVLVFALMMGNYRVFDRYLNLRPHISKKEVAARKTIEKDLEFLLRTFFFVFIGIITVLSYDYLLIAIVIFIITMLARYLESLVVFFRKSQILFRNFTFSLMSHGTTDAVLATLLLTTGIAYSERIFYIVFILIILSNIATSILISKSDFKTTTQETKSQAQAQ